MISNWKPANSYSQSVSYHQHNAKYLQWTIRLKYLLKVMHLKRIENIFIIFILVHKYLPIGKIFSRFVLYKPCHSASKAPVTYCLLFVFEAWVSTANSMNALLWHSKLIDDVAYHVSSFIIECWQRLHLQSGDECEWHGDCVRLNGEGSTSLGSADLHAPDEAEGSHGHC